MGVRVTPSEARAAIAAAYLGQSPDNLLLGTIELRPHQSQIVSRIRSSIAEFGGALLCDPVGTGKTFSALAVAKSYKRTLVVGPAVLRPMWLKAAKDGEMAIVFISHESLSRGRTHQSEFDFVIVDEAHHARNPATRRFAALSALVSRRDVLLLSATPIHNRRDDLIAVLSLFLGSRAGELDTAERSRCVLRREALSESVLHMPRIEPLQWVHIAHDDDVAALLLSLPPPLPPSDGDDGGVLIVHSLIRQWASSDEALRGGLIRRRQRALALMSALESGTYPSRQELRAWTCSEDSVQLAFSELLAPPNVKASLLLETVRRHHDAVSRILDGLPVHSIRDSAVATWMASLRKQYAKVPIVAFSQYEDTVTGLFRNLVSSGGVAALSGRGGRVAGGRMTRDEVLTRFAPRASGHCRPTKAEEITLLLTTDLLSEGVNLQDAGVVIHLDLPWTPARMEQRLGRIARIGSLHGSVASYAVHPPATAESLASIERILAKKLQATRAVVETFPSLLPANVVYATRSEPSVVESFRATLEKWRASCTNARLPVRGECVYATGASLSNGFLAACEAGGRVVLIGSLDGRIEDDPSHIARCVDAADSMAISCSEHSVAEAMVQLANFVNASLALDPVAPRQPGRHRSRDRLLRAIARSVQSARPHDRVRMTALAGEARRVVMSTLGDHVERELLRMGADGDAETWLESIASLGQIHRKRGIDSASHHVRAMIVFVRSPRMSCHPQRNADGRLSDSG